MKAVAALASDDPTIVWCVGDNVSLLKFEVGPMNWLRIPVDNDKRSLDGFDGTLRYGSACFVPPCPDEKIIFSGGCFATNGFPASKVTEFTIKTIKKPKKKRPMLLKRYGHLSVYLNGIVYCVGGFSHKDLPNE